MGRSADRAGSSASKARGVFDRFVGSHRIQRVPKNGGGKRHSSTVTVVAVGGSAGAELTIDDADIDYQVTKGSGAGGQHRNKVETAVRAIHRPTETRVFVQVHKSQWKNRQEARRELVERVSALHAGEQLEQERAEESRRFRTVEGLGLGRMAGHSDRPLRQSNVHVACVKRPLQVRWRGCPYLVQSTVRWAEAIRPASSARSLWAWVFGATEVPSTRRRRGWPCEHSWSAGAGLATPAVIMASQMA